MTIYFENCPFCSACLPAQAFACGDCGCDLSLSNIEQLLSRRSAPASVRDSVEKMEAERSTREFSSDDLSLLALGYLNLGEFQQGLACLTEASRKDPNNVILAGQMNAIAIRIDELRRQDEDSLSAARGKTILVVDDSATVRKLISSKLEKAGHNVVCAVDGVEAMSTLESVSPDLVLLDINMPNMDGYQVCKLIRAKESLSEVPVVMISGNDGFFDKVRGKMAGTTDYITKPFGPETLMKALDTYLIPTPVTA
jgi:twitching motility two-component system response regulator PilG